MSEIVSYRYRLLPDRGCEEISDQVQALTGYSPSVFLETPSFFLDIVHPQEHSIVLQLLMGVLGSGRLRWMRADGSPVWVEMTAAPVRADAQMVVVAGEVRRTTPPPGRCARYRPVCLELLEGGAEG